MTPRLSICFAFFLALLCAAGCGLSDYQENMKESQKRAKRFDEEVRLLDEVAKIPLKEVENKATKEKDKMPMVDLFLPLPRGIDGKHELAPFGGFLWQYHRSQPKAATSAPGPPAPPQPALPGHQQAGTTEFMEVALAWNYDEKRENFEKSVLQLFPRSKEEPLKTEKNCKSVDRPNIPLTNIKYDSYEFYDPQYNYYCSVNFHTLEMPKESGNGKDFLNLAICFKVERSKQLNKPVSDDAATAIQFCLEMMVLGSTNQMAFKHYMNRSPKQPLAPVAPPPGQQPTPPPPLGPAPLGPPPLVPKLGGKAAATR